MTTTKSTPVAILDDYQNIVQGIFSKLGERVQLHTFPNTLDTKDPEQKVALIKRLNGFPVICTMRERTALPLDVISELPDLKLILTTGMVNASIPIKACVEKGILVVGTSGKRIISQRTTTKSLSPSLQSTVELTWALILASTKLIPQNSNEITHGRWQTGLLTGLAGKTLGIVGFGRIGSMVARVAVLGFGMKVIAWSSSLTQEQTEEKAADLGLDIDAVKAAGSKMDLFRDSDVISLHYVLSDRSRGIVGKDELDAMKPSAFLINTSRSGLVNEAALLDCLKRGQIKGVGLDVFDTEPLPVHSEWRSQRWGENGMSHVILSPHMGYANEEVIKGWYEECADNLGDWLDGRRPNSVIS